MATQAETVPARGGRVANGETRNGSSHNNSRSQRRGGRGGRGSNRRGRGQAAMTAPYPAPNIQLPGPTVEARPDNTPERAEKLGKGAEEELEAEVCFICASPVVHQSLAPCNHRTCHICSLRLRALYKTRACAHCRVGLGFFALMETVQG